MKKLLLLAALLGTLSATAQVEFDRYFFDRTMRFDYQHAGNATSEHYYYNGLKAEPYWAGSKRSLCDTTNLGNQRFRIVDLEEEREIYSRGYCTLFNEWQATEEAQSVERAYAEAVVFPYPKRPCRIEFYGRNRKGEFELRYSQKIDPESYWVEQMRPRFETFDVVYHGAPEHRVDIVVLPEGYSREERAKFEEA